VFNENLVNEKCITVASVRRIRSAYAGPNLLHHNGIDSRLTSMPRRFNKPFKLR
jgi:hypothetical protein